MWPKASTRECWCRMWFARMSRRMELCRAEGMVGFLDGGLGDCL